MVDLQPRHLENIALKFVNGTFHDVEQTYGTMMYVRFPMLKKNCWMKTSCFWTNKHSFVSTNTNYVFTFNLHVFEEFLFPCEWVVHMGECINQHLWMALVEKGKYLTENNLFEKTFHQMAKIHHQKKKGCVKGPLLFILFQTS